MPEKIVDFHPVKIKNIRYAGYALAPYCDIFLDILQNAEEPKDYDIIIIFRDQGKWCEFTATLAPKCRIAKPLRNVGGYKSNALRLETHGTLQIQMTGKNGNRIRLTFSHPDYKQPFTANAPSICVMPFFRPI